MTRYLKNTIKDILPEKIVIYDAFVLRSWVTATWIYRLNESREKGDGSFSPSMILRR